MLHVAVCASGLHTIRWLQNARGGEGHAPEWGAEAARRHRKVRGGGKPPTLFFLLVVFAHRSDNGKSVFGMFKVPLLSTALPMLPCAAAESRRLVTRLKDGEETGGYVDEARTDVCDFHVLWRW